MPCVGNNLTFLRSSPYEHISLGQVVACLKSAKIKNIDDYICDCGLKG